MTTRQEFFDTTMKKLIEQGQPSYNPETESCLYRGPENLKCAIGHWIPDEDYTPKMEDKSVRGADEYCPTIGKLTAEFGLDFLEDLQSAHDSPTIAGLKGNAWVEQFKIECRNITQKYELEYKS